MSFFNKYLAATKKNESYVCVGLDSDITKLPSIVKTESNPLLVFNKRIIDETHQYVACYKINMAFYLALGGDGVEVVKKTIEYIPDNIPVIIDIKAGDIGNTMEQYAFSVFRYFKADAMTINILMGSDVVNACFTIEDSFCFALVLTSNPSAKQYFTHNDLYKKLAIIVNKFGHERIGAVVGATRSDDFNELRELMPETIFLIPGVGAQGGDLNSVCENAIYTKDDARILVNSSRAIIYANSTDRYAETAGKEAKLLRERITELIGNETGLWQKRKRHHL